MILIIGGAYQGKLQYALEEFSIEEEKVFYCYENTDIINFDKKIINNINLFIWAILKKGENPLEYIKKNLDKFEDKIIICEDISCGIVPTDEAMRNLREQVGHSLAIISKKSDRVVRLFCGIPTVIK